MFYQLLDISGDPILNSTYCVATPKLKTLLFSNVYHYFGLYIEITLYIDHSFFLYVHIILKYQDTEISTFLVLSKKAKWHCRKIKITD